MTGNDKYGKLQKTVDTYSKALQKSHETHTDTVLNAYKSESPIIGHAKSTSGAVTSPDVTKSKGTHASRHLQIPYSILSMLR